MVWRYGFWCEDIEGGWQWYEATAKQCKETPECIHCKIPEGLTPYYNIVLWEDKDDTV